MGPLDTLNHLFNFLAPALAVSLALALLGPFLIQKRSGAPAVIAQATINFVVGAAVLLFGLWFFGNDGKMASYAWMLLLCTAAQASSGAWGK